MKTFRTVGPDLKAQVKVYGGGDALSKSLKVERRFPTYFLFCKLLNNNKKGIEIFCKPCDPAQC